MLVVSPYIRIARERRQNRKKSSRAKHHRWEVRFVYSKFRSNLFSSLGEISWSLLISALIALQLTNDGEMEKLVNAGKTEIIVMG
jgi:hypothetical protein